jgi:hypothetical protein
MLSLDLFTSKFEQQIHEGAVDSVLEQDQPDPQEKIPTNINQFNTEDNRTLVKKIWAQISQHAINDTAGWLTLEWPNQPAATLSRNQVWTVINKIAKMPTTQRNAFALSTLGNRNAFLTWMNSLKIITRPAPKKDPARGQQSLDLKEAEKKSSDNPKYKDVRVQRAMRQAAADYPTAGSDAEAFAKSMLDAQDQDQENIAKLRQSTQRQRDLLDKNDRLDQRQQQMLGSLEKEINDVEQTNTSLEKTLQQMQQANAALQKRLDQMRGKPVATPTIPVEPGVSVATDKIAPQPAPATTPPIDTRARQYAQQLRKQLNQLQTMVALKAPEDPGQLNQLQQKIDTLTAQIAKLQQQEPITTATQATVGGQQADVLGKQTSADTKTQTSADTETDDGVIDLTGIDDVLAPYRKPAKKSAKKKSKKVPKFELTETDTIPLKSVVQGYSVEYNPQTKQVTVSRGGQVIGSAINKSGNPKYHSSIVTKIIDRSEEDKYPTDIDVRDVVLPMKRVAEALPAKALEKLYRWKNTQNQPVAEPEVTPTEPQPVPARLSDLQSKKQRIDNLASIKQDIEKLQARATRGGRMLPRGLAADLEDYFTTADIDTAYDDMMAKYQKQLGALQQYLGMRKALWSPKKDVHEMRATELQEGGPETWTVHFTDGTTTRVRVPSDETDPAQVRAFFAKKGKTVKKFDYGFTTEPAAGPGPEPHEPGSGSAVSGRTGKELPEDALDRSGQKMYQAQEVYMLTHNGQEVAFYKLKDLKRAEQDAQDMQRKLGGEVHLRKVMREAEQQPQDDVMKRLFKDFGDIFGKQPPEPKPQEPEKKEVKEMNRAGYNPLTSQQHWYEVERQLAQLINDRTLDPESRAEARQRYLEKRKEAQQKGWAK